MNSRGCGRCVLVQRLVLCIATLLNVWYATQAVHAESSAEGVARALGVGCERGNSGVRSGSCAFARIGEDVPVQVAQVREANSKACVDRCGDGVCQEIVCMAVGCPCAETPTSCPQDCAPTDKK
jgi:hypothetical protein